MTDLQVLQPSLNFGANLRGFVPRIFALLGVLVLNLIHHINVSWQTSLYTVFRAKVNPWFIVWL